MDKFLFSRFNKKVLVCYTTNKHGHTISTFHVGKFDLIVNNLSMDMSKPVSMKLQDMLRDSVTSFTWP